MAERAREVRRARAPYLGPERRRPMFLDAAAEAFATDGYRGASLAEIAAKAGVVKAVLYDCFPGGKAQLHQDVLAIAANRFIQTVARKLDAETVASPVEAVVASARGLIAYAEQNPHGFRLLFTAPTGGASVTARVSAARNRAVGELARRALFVLAALGHPQPESDE